MFQKGILRLHVLPLRRQQRSKLAPDRMNHLLFNTFKIFLEERGVQSSELGHEETKDIIATWTQKFTIQPPGKNEALWHTFSLNHFPCESGAHAMKKLNETPLKTFVIFSPADLSAIKCTAPYACFIPYEELQAQWMSIRYRMDIFIVQSNFTWTFVHTHEQDFGPYYALSDAR